MQEGKELAAAFGKVVREERLARGFSQEAFAYHAGLHRTFMGSVERGKSMVTILTASKIASGLDMTIGELFAKIDGQLRPEMPPD